MATMTRLWTMFAGPGSAVLDDEGRDACELWMNELREWLERDARMVRTPCGTGYWYPEARINRGLDAPADASPVLRVFMPAERHESGGILGPVGTVSGDRDAAKPMVEWMREVHRRHCHRSVCAQLKGWDRSWAENRLFAEDATPIGSEKRKLISTEPREINGVRYVCALTELPSSAGCLVVTVDGGNCDRGVAWFRSRREAEDYRADCAAHDRRTGVSPMILVPPEFAGHQVAVLRLVEQVLGAQYAAEQDPGPETTNAPAPGM